MDVMLYCIMSSTQYHAQWQSKHCCFK